MRVDLMRAALFEAARRKFLSDPDVRQCDWVTGDAEFSLMVAPALKRDNRALTRRLLFGNHNVKRLRTPVVADPIET
jgi:Lrp/AsnC family leucine-responsive transcriptional regulator